MKRLMILMASAFFVFALSACGGGGGDSSSSDSGSSSNSITDATTGMVLLKVTGGTYTNNDTKWLSYDKQITPARRTAKQCLHFGERGGINGTALGLAALTAEVCCVQRLLPRRTDTARL